MRTGLVLLVMVCVLAAAFAEQPQEAIDFSIRDIDGEKHKLADYDGKVVLLNFWATWCTPCHLELPVILQAYEAHADDGFQVLGMAIMDNPDNLEKNRNSAGIPYPVFANAEAVFKQYQELVPDGQQGSIPCNILIGRDGRIAYVKVGKLTEEEFMPVLSEALGNQ